MADYKIHDLYQGGYSSLDSDSAGGFIGYRIPAGDIGLATDPRTANILQEASTKLSSGIKTIELSMIQPDVIESIPKQHFREINRLSQITGVGMTVHGPLIEPSGFNPQQGSYNEYARAGAERQMLSAVEKAHEVNPDGNIPVVFHSSQGWGGAQYRKLSEEEAKKPGVEGREEITMLPVINQESGQTTVVQPDIRYDPLMSSEQLAEGERYSVEKQLRVRNDTEWNSSITQLVQIKERTNKMIGETEPIVREIQNKLPEGRITEESKQRLTPTEREVISRYIGAGLELGDIHKHLNALFERAYKYGGEEQKEALHQVSENFRKQLEATKDMGLKGQSEALDNLMTQLGRFPAPEIYKPVEKFLLDKSGATFGNVAFQSYKKFGDKAPIISIENPPVGMGYSRGEDLKNVVESSREQFVKAAMKSEDQGGLGMNEKEAQKQAKKLIGVTWDVGHINMLRKYGYDDKDLIKEAEKVAPLVKHVHLSDNFGYEHTELPMGMGNVPMKEIMERLGEKGFEAKKIIEAGNWWQHFKTSPVQETFQAFGSPIYGMKMAPYWNQYNGLQQGYFGGYGMMLPQVNYETFGAGFSQLPAELGGQRVGGGRGSRMSGRGME